VAKVSVVGTGNLGSTIAYNLAVREIAKELVLVDVKEGLAEGHAMDIEHGLAFSDQVRVSAGTMADTAGSDVVVISAGKPRTPQVKTRLDLAKINAPEVAQISADVRDSSPDAVIVTLTNPLDVSNYVAWKVTGFPRERVVGSAGMLDSSRLRVVLAQEFNVDAGDVEAFTLGEHGQSQVPAFSKLKVKGEPVEVPQGKREQVLGNLKQLSMNVIKKKGWTQYAPAQYTGDMINAILTGKEVTAPCSAVLDGEYGLADLSLGVPVTLAAGGIKKIHEWPLDEWERGLFTEAAEKIRGYCSEIMKAVEAR